MTLRETCHTTVTDSFFILFPPPPLPRDLNFRNIPQTQVFEESPPLLILLSSKHKSWGNVARSCPPWTTRADCKARPRNPRQILIQKVAVASGRTRGAAALHATLFVCEFIYFWNHEEGREETKEVRQDRQTEIERLQREREREILRARGKENCSSIEAETKVSLHRQRTRAACQHFAERELFCGSLEDTPKMTTTDSLWFFICVNVTECRCVPTAQSTFCNLLVILQGYCTSNTTVDKIIRDYCSRGPLRSYYPGTDFIHEKILVVETSLSFYAAEPQSAFDLHASAGNFPTPLPDPRAKGMEDLKLSTHTHTQFS